ncbi:MAG: ZIP family metal transporter [Candidatus Aenigmarchaeota archaeon]|nr:ZIP family metal transporter [Candidatus Aenigmarchaeota archaeon]
MVFLLALTIVFLISILGISGGILLIYNQKLARLFSKYFINFAIGALLAAVFFDLLPEAVASGGNVLVYSLIGILTFYFLEKTLLWYHHHSVEHIISHAKNRHPPEEKIHPAGYLITLSDALHNFIDGLLIAASFLVDIKLGITTSLAVLFHELPQEMGEFAILLHSKFSRAKIILYSLAAQMTAIAGALMGFFYLPISENLGAILAFTAGGFLYIACTDLLPETHREKKLGESLIQVGLLIFGILVMWYVGQIFHE